MPDPLRRTGLVYDERCLAHLNPLPFGPHPEWVPVAPFERPERLTLTERAVRGAGVPVVDVPARAASELELALVHTDEHLERIRAADACEAPVEVGPEAWAGPGSWEAACVAAGGMLEATAAVATGELDNAFVLARPAGHHASADRAMGFCLFNATAVAARWAQREVGVRRVAILDWDVHHGNGTEAIFAGDADVLTVSLHQEGLYPPGSGATGTGGVAALNVALPPGTGDDGYLHAWERAVVPAVEAFAPDLVLVGAGQDAAASDPLGRMSMTVPGFRALADAAVSLCGGRLVAFLEGGYSLMHLPLCTLAVVEALAGVPATFAYDPVGCDVPDGLRDAEREAVARAL